MMNVEVNKFKGRSVLITGGFGFLGSNLAIRLVELGAYVVIIDNLHDSGGGNRFNLDGYTNQVAIVIADICDEKRLYALVQGKDYVFNLAGQRSHIDSILDPYTDLESNCRGQLSILEACRRTGCTARIVFASTRQVYGKPLYLPVDEQHSTNPVDINGVHKLAGEKYHTLYYRLHGLKTCCLRLTNTYGPRMRVKDARQSFLSIWIRNIIEGNPLEIYGDGSQFRDFNYVDDVVDALLLAVANDATIGGIFNLGHPQPISLKDLAMRLITIHDSGSCQLVPFLESRKAIDIGNYCGDYSRFQQITQWEPRISLDDGLTKTLDFFSRYSTFYWDC